MAGRFATLDSLKKSSDKGSEKGGEQKESYVGGTSAQGGGSGLNVVGPPSDGRSDGDLVGGIFDRARNSGATGPPPESEDTTRRTITMYRNGFVVDDGPFRPLDDPANEAFLRDLHSGVVPRELEAQIQGRHVQVSVNLVDKREEDFTPPPPPSYVAYSGEGKTAGVRSVQESAVVSSGGEVPVPDVNPSSPSTQIQIVLHNGKKITRKFNTNNTIRHIIAVIASEGGGTAPYRLLAGFPPAELTGFDRTIEEAGLKGARINQKLV